jgi:hypothetical protein
MIISPHPRVFMPEDDHRFNPNSQTSGTTARFVKIVNVHVTAQANSRGPTPPESLLLLVVGSSLRAEEEDRPIAYALAEQVRSRLSQTDEDPSAAPARPLVCSDIWYLNDDTLAGLPVISIGGPGDNALTAYLGDKIPAAMAIDDALLVQADLSFERLQACCWGSCARGTEAAADAFAERYLDPFLDAARRVWE